MNVGSSASGAGAGASSAPCAPKKSRREEYLEELRRTNARLNEIWLRSLQYRTLKRCDPQTNSLGLSEIVYKGRTVKDGKPVGQGKKVLIFDHNKHPQGLNKKGYNGIFKNGKLEGRGKTVETYDPQTNPHGLTTITYEGTFKEGKKEGPGKWMFIYHYLNPQGLLAITLEGAFDEANVISANGEIVRRERSEKKSFNVNIKKKDGEVGADIDLVDPTTSNKISGSTSVPFNIDNLGPLIDLLPVTDGDKTEPPKKKQRRN